MAHMSHVSQMAHYVPNVPSVPNVHVSHISQMSHVVKKQSPTDYDGKYFCNGKYKSHGRSESFIMAPPSAHIGGDMLVYFCQLSAFIVLSHSFLSVCPALSIVQAVKHETLTQCWATVGPLSTTLSQH